MKIKSIVLLVCFLSIASFAQTKVGTINSDYIIGLMPETKIVMKRSQAYGAKLDSSYSIKLKEYQARVNDFRTKEKNNELGELMKKTLAKEILAMEGDIQKYQDNGSKLMQLKQNELMRPLYAKLNKAIEEIAKANGYSQILTTAGNQFAYIDPKYDITKLVLDKLGIKEPEQVSEKQ